MAHKNILRNIFIIYVCFLGLTLFSQAENTDKKLKKFYFGIEYFHQWNYRFIQKDKYNPNEYLTVPEYHPDGADAGLSGRQYRYYTSKNDIGDWGYGIGLYGKSLLGQKFMIKYGLAAEFIKYKTKLIDTLYTKTTYYTGGTTITEISKAPNQFSVDYYFQVFSAPVSFQYNIDVSDKLFLNTSLGICPSYMQAIYSDITNHDTNEIKRYDEQNIFSYQFILTDIVTNTFAKGTVGLNYKFDKWFFITLEPYYKMNIFEIHPHKWGNTIRLYNFGAKLSFNF